MQRYWKLSYSKWHCRQITVVQNKISLRGLWHQCGRVMISSCSVAPHCYGLTWGFPICFSRWNGCFLYVDYFSWPDVRRYLVQAVHMKCSLLSCQCLFRLLLRLWSFHTARVRIFFFVHDSWVVIWGGRSLLFVSRTWIVIFNVLHIIFAVYSSICVRTIGVPCNVNVSWQVHFAAWDRFVAKLICCRYTALDIIMYICGVHRRIFPDVLLYLIVKCYGWK